MGFVNYASLNADAQQQLLASHLPLGQHPKTSAMFVMREADRFSGTYILGVAGSGKSGAMQQMILADAAKGNAIIVIDPHSDLADNCLATLPKERLAHTYVLDMLDEAYPFGINLFGLSGKPKTSSEKSQAVDRVIHVFEVLWPEVANQQHLPNYIRTATIALINSPGMTLLHMRRFLTDQPFRSGILAHVSDPTVHEVWREHDRLSPSQQHTRIQPLLNRLGALFIGRDLIQNIVGQPTTISFRQAIEQREIVFIKLPTNRLEQDARLLGTIILAQISAALFSFADLPEPQRPGFSLYVDEFQNFSTPDFARMFTEGRKFGMKVTLAHQLRTQLDDSLLESATASARTKLCFQLEGNDAKEMAQYFPAPDDGRLEEIEAHACAALLKNPGSDGYVRLFTDLYLRPLQSQRSGGKVKIENAGLDLATVLWVGYDRAKEAAKSGAVVVEDPTQYVDSLLRDVMQSRNAGLPIPPKAVVGFANCGHGFYRAVKHLAPCDELTGGYVFPSDLVAGGRWIRAPKNDREQFLHFVFCLRQVMRYLAAHPMGKKAEAGTAAVSQLLTQLPRRHALVRSGDEVGRILTYDTPKPVIGDELAQRIAIVQAQTRAKYCRARDEVEHHTHEPDELPLTPASVVQAVHQVVVTQPRSRWVEVGEP